MGRVVVVVGVGVVVVVVEWVVGCLLEGEEVELGEVSEELWRRLEMLIDFASCFGEALGCVLGGLRGSCGPAERPLIIPGEE